MVCCLSKSITSRANVCNEQVDDDDERLSGTTKIQIIHSFRIRIRIFYYDSVEQKMTV